MEQLRTAWDSTLGKHLSLKRVAGLALLWLWMIMMFYSIVPYGFSSDVRGSLYASLLVSLVTMVVTMLFVVVIVRRERICQNRSVVAGSAVMMCLGSALTPFSDPNTPTGMLVLGISAIMTGTGSAVLFLCWIEHLSSLGGRLALVELAMSLCMAFIAGFILITTPPLPAIVAVAAVPIGSAWLLRSCSQSDVQLVKETEEPLSRNTIALFVKSLAGAALIGALAGFFDVVSGCKTYEVQDIFGAYLFLAGFIGALAVCLIAVFLHRDSIFFSYRLSMLMLCLGCLSTPFLADNNTYSSALIFGGYHCYVMVLCVVCIDVATSFKIGAARAIGLGFVALYGGETMGSLLAHSLEATGIPLFDLTVVTLVAVSILFIAHLFLFTETDLIKIGIGEVSMVAPVSEDAEESRESQVDPCDVIADRFRLSPRETDVLPLLLEGRTISRIQETLFISAGTVSTHIRHIYQKTGVNNRQELIDLAHGSLEDGAV
ncbi:MAG: hypothetical protein PEGG_00998 [Paraeggerthella hongkongensis]|uniref:helix-turn-helix transcriptional regulator n=1 Tax=Paraeggerthella sp. TaxID=2897350 RepID=UPI0030E5CAB0